METPDWVRAARITEFVVPGVRERALRSGMSDAEAYAHIGRLAAQFPEETALLNGSVIWLDGHYPYPNDRREDDPDGSWHTGQCNRAMFPYDRYDLAAFDLTPLLDGAHQRDQRVVTYVDFVGCLTTMPHAAEYAKRDVFGNPQSHWPWIAYATCPNNPEWEAFCVEQARGVMAMGFDGIFFDDANRPLHAMPCHCEHCVALFRERYSAEPPRWPGEPLWTEWSLLPYVSMASLVGKTRAAVKESGDDKVVVSNANMLIWPELCDAEDGHVSDFPGTPEKPEAYLRSAAELYQAAKGKPIWLGHYYTPTVEHYAKALALNMSMRASTKLQYHFEYDVLTAENPALAQLVSRFFAFQREHRGLYADEQHLVNFQPRWLPSPLFATAFQGDALYLHLAAKDAGKVEYQAPTLPLSAGKVQSVTLCTLDGDRELSWMPSFDAMRLEDIAFEHYAVLRIS